MFSIYKYPVLLNEETESMYVSIPTGSEVISVDLIDSTTAYIYAIVDQEVDSFEIREILWLGTGWNLDQETRDKMSYYEFLGTCKINDLKNNLVYHFWIEYEYHPMDDLFFLT